MSELKRLLKESFDIWVKKRWLKEIDRSIERYKNAYNKAIREHHVMNALINRYNEIYGENFPNK